MLNSIQIKNYKCFWETERIGFSPSWNIIMGKNNVGKSSLLSALSLVDVQNSPYRGISTPRNATQNPHSILKFEFSISGIDLKRSLLSSDTKFQWQWHRQMSNMRHSDFEELHNTFNKLLNDGSIIVSGAHAMSQGLSFNGVTTGGGLQIQPGILTSCFSSTRDRQSIVFEANGPAHNQNYLGQLLSQNYVPSFYLFKAERMHI